MSKLEELIEKLCPKGVIYKNIGDIVIIEKGKQLNKTLLSDSGKYPVINGGITPSGYWDEYNYQEGLITISQGGASAGFVNYIETKFWAGAHCYVVSKVNEGINYRYIYHFLKSKEVELQNFQVGAGIPSISLLDIKKLYLAVPPIEVQNEIVRILDNFTELEAELEAELVARRKQYEYYRNEIIEKFDYKLVKLKDIIIKSSSGGTPLKSNNEFYENGKIPWLRTQDIKFNEIYQINSFITEKAVQCTSVKWIPENCVIVAISGASAGRCAINKIKTTTNQHCLNMQIDNTKAIYRYVFYCVCSRYEELLSMKQGARGDLNSSKILSLKIPLPKIEEQEKIVSILDRFDKLCNDISEGLPAELEARRKQYEYYRDKLLTFKEIKNG